MIKDILPRGAAHNTPKTRRLAAHGAPTHKRRTAGAGRLVYSVLPPLRRCRTESSVLPPATMWARKYNQLVLRAARARQRWRLAAAPAPLEPARPSIHPSIHPHT